MPGICVAVKATTSKLGSSRKATLKLWKSRPPAPMMITLRIAVLLSGGVVLLSAGLRVGIDQEGVLRNRHRARLEPRSGRVDLERSVLVEDLDVVGVGIVGKAERLFEAL